MQEKETEQKKGCCCASWIDIDILFHCVSSWMIMYLDSEGLILQWGFVQSKLKDYLPRLKAG